MSMPSAAAASASSRPATRCSSTAARVSTASRPMPGNCGVGTSTGGLRSDGAASSNRQYWRGHSAIGHCPASPVKTRATTAIACCAASASPACTLANRRARRSSPRRNAVTAAGEGVSGAAGVMGKARARPILAGRPADASSKYRLTHPRVAGSTSTGAACGQLSCAQPSRNRHPARFHAVATCMTTVFHEQVTDSYGNDPNGGFFTSAQARPM